MKKKAVCMLLGVLLTGTLLTGCGKNKATEAASESAQTEKEGTGERTADSAEDDQKKTDETADTKTDKKAEKGTDAEETGEDASETEENREKIAVLLPDEQNWTRDAKELEVQFEEDGYDPILLYADNDSSNPADGSRRGICHGDRPGRSLWSGRCTCRCKGCRDRDTGDFL